MSLSNPESLLSIVDFLQRVQIADDEEALAGLDDVVAIRVELQAIR